MQLPTLVLDFDGTVCLGDGPIWAYAERVLPHLEPEVRREVRAALAGYLAQPWTSPGYPDGYTALADLAGKHIDGKALGAAYLDSRPALADPAMDIHAPDGLADLLEEIAGLARPVVLTNAPSTGLDAALIRLGLARRIEGVVHSAAKPDGAPKLLAELLGGAPASHLMSVGDLWANDIAPALEMGCATALIDRTCSETRAAHARAADIQDLYPAIREWAADPGQFVKRHDPNHAVVADTLGLG